MLAPVADEARPALAADPDLAAALEAAGFSQLGAEALEALNRAAGNYARNIQLEERAEGMTRDHAQTVNNRAMCERLAEATDLVRRHNERVADR